MNPRGEAPLTYPVTSRIDQVDDYHGTAVADPYRWLEDLDAPETAAWVEQQNDVTFGYLGGIPFRASIRDRLEKLWDHDKYGIPFRAGDTYFFAHQTGLQNQFVVSVASSLDEEPRLLVDPNTWSDDGTVALIDMAASRDGRYLAYGSSSGGSDWQEWRVVDVATGQLLPDHLEHVKFSGAAWTADGAGFFYSRFDDPSKDFEAANFNQKIYYHRLGTPQADDELVYARPDHPDWLLFGSVSDDGRWLVIWLQRGTDPKNGLAIQDLSEAGDDVRELFADFDAAYNLVGNDGDTFFIQTDQHAPLGRVIAVDVRDPSRRREVVPEAGDALVGTTLVSDRLFCQYLSHARSVVKVFALDGTSERDVDLPGLGTAAGFGGRREHTETFYVFTSVTEPATIYRYDIAAGSSTLYRRPHVAFDPEAYETSQVFYESKDGTRVPMFITHRKGVALDGQNPTLLYGYGGFNVPMVPQFAVSVIGWLEIGGVYATACLRGGSEYGEEWHLAGTKERKQNVFDDFIAAAEWLIATGYTSTPKLAINGGSNGGLLVGACITQRPDLFGAARIAVGVLDMLRFHRFTIGWGWTSDYGCADELEDFKYLYAYSPLHNVKPGTCYPATLITTADHDDRVVPSHSFKFAATLQPAQACDKPVLIRVDVRAGHGMGKPTAKLIDEAADVWSFLAANLGIEVGF